MISSTRTHNPARAVQYLCKLLQGYGVGNQQLTPELVRQAKFDTPESLQPLLLALHDLALLVLAGFPPKSREALRQLKQQLQQDGLLHAGADLPPQGRLLLLHCLSTWDCPQGLLAQLTLPCPSSRSALLALCWLINHAQLFDRALQQLQLPVDLMLLLPPYPEDTCFTAEAQAHCQAAAARTRQHQQHILQLMQQQSAPAPAAGPCSRASSRKAPGVQAVGSSSDGCWQAVQTAAHHVLASYRGATLRLQQVACLAEAREKLLHDIQQAQQHPHQQRQKAAAQQQAAGAAAQATAEPPSSSKQVRSRSSLLGGNGGRSAGTKHTPVLTAYELHLLAHPRLLQQHQVALERAIDLLQQQQECKQHATVFFAWAASVVAEAQQTLHGPSPPADHANSTRSNQAGPNAPSSQAPTAAAAAAAASKQRLKQQETAASLLLPQCSVQDMLPLVRQLPSANSELAATVLDRVKQQLEQAAAAAGVHPSDAAMSPSTTDSSGVTSRSTYLSAQDPAGQLAAAMHQWHFAAPETNSRQEPPQQQQQQHVATTLAASYAQTAAAALVLAGILPECVLQELRELPDDLQRVVQAQQQQQQAQQVHQQQLTATSLDVLQSGSWRRQHVEQQHSQVLHSRQQPPHQAGGAAAAMQAVAEADRATAARGRSAAVAEPHAQQTLPHALQRQRAAGDVSSGAAAASVVTADDEVQRLKVQALQVARQLAKIRAANKQQLAAAAQALLAAGDSSKGQLVLYQA